MRSRPIAPRTVADLEAIRSLPPAVVRKRGEELLELMRVAVESPDMANVQSATQRATPEENALVTQAAADRPQRSGCTGDEPRSDRDAP